MRLNTSDDLNDNGAVFIADHFLYVLYLACGLFYKLFEPVIFLSHRPYYIFVVGHVSSERDQQRPRAIDWVYLKEAGENPPDGIDTHHIHKDLFEQRKQVG